MPNLLDLMKPEDREKAKLRFKQRTEKREDSDNRIPNEMYLVAEFGYYFGYEGIRDVRDNKITLEEMNALLEGARKVWYVKLVEQANIMRVVAESANVFAKRTEKNKLYRDGTKPFRRRASE